MAWTEIDKYRVNELVDGTTLDVIKGNIEYLHAPNFASYQHLGTGSDYSNTGTIGADIDGTNFVLSLTTYGGVVMAGFYGVFTSGGDEIRLHIVKTDPVASIGRNLFYNYAAAVSATVRTGHGWIQYFPDLPAGTHEFRAIWGVSPGSSTLHVAHRPYMFVAEV